MSFIGPGARFVLETSQNLVGCFCFHFQEQNNVNNKFKPYHTFKVLVGGKEKMSIVESNTKWKNYYVQIESTEPVKVRTDMDFIVP